MVLTEESIRWLRTNEKAFKFLTMSERTIVVKIGINNMDVLDADGCWEFAEVALGFKSNAIYRLQGEYKVASQNLERFGSTIGNILNLNFNIRYDEANRTYVKHLGTREECKVSLEHCAFILENYLKNKGHVISAFGLHQHCSECCGEYECTDFYRED